MVPPAFTAECGLIGCEITVAPAPLWQNASPGAMFLNLVVLDAEGISLVSANPLSPSGDSLNGGTGYWAPLSSFILLVVLAFIIQEGERMARTGTFACNFYRLRNEFFMLYWIWIKAKNLLCKSILAKYLYQSRYAI